MQSLFQIAQTLCMKQAARISDVGDTPYHLIKPVLRRLNSKQLASLEANSPMITPETDELWASLIEKEFPDRPYNASQVQLINTGEDHDMPNRALFKQYTQEKEDFLACSAQRLRKMTAKMKKEKSENSIVPIKTIMRDPSIRRRPVGAGQNFLLSSRPKSIIGKVRRDMSERHLMFRPTDSQPARSSKNPYMPRRERTSTESSTKASQNRKLPDLTAMNTSAPNGVYSHRPKQQQPSSPVQLPKRVQPNSHSTSRSAAPPNIASTSRPIRRPHPPMFLNSRKKPRLASSPPPPPPPERDYTKRAPAPAPLSKSPVKSSIFY